MSIENLGHVTDAAKRVPASTPWDERVDSWEVIAATPAFRRLADSVLALASPRDSDVVVDLGAGTGLLSIPAARRAGLVHAIDYSAPMLEKLADRAGREGLANLHCTQADLRQIPLADETASVVMSSYAFHHLADDGKELALAEARRILRPGGILVICDMMFSLSLRGPNRRIVASKVKAIARKGPAGFARLARNAGRVATGRWEHPTPPTAWDELLRARRFVDVSVGMVEQEAGIAVARRPGITTAAGALEA